MPRCYPPDPEFGEGRHGERRVWEALQRRPPRRGGAALLRLARRGRPRARGRPARPVARRRHRARSRSRAARSTAGRAAAAGGAAGAPTAGRSRTRWCRPRTPGTRCSATWTGSGCPGGTGAAPAGAAAHAPAAGATTRRTCRAGWCSTAADLDGIADRLRAAVEAGDGHAPLDARDVAAVRDLLTAQLPGQTSLLSQAEEHEQRVDQMTRDQVRTLDSLRHHTRLAVVGGAGTGKTWLALEQAERLSANGQRVALLCYSRGLGRFLQRVTATWARPPALRRAVPRPGSVEWGAPPRVRGGVGLLRDGPAAGAR